ncbi:hypothetical protein SAY87_004456 [Trapa incisa]|uniref:Protein NRDE2 homolog n=1 Tax=Trapa incisa TaxID=236973 RepID=A0AAN7JNY4_9MYRT|nr:hypothetical protein SAY87_004456 [Trapa incisa]
MAMADESAASVDGGATRVDVPPVGTREQAPEEINTSLFPLSSASLSIAAPPSVPQWLSNSSFTVDLSTINDAVASIHRGDAGLESEPESEEEMERQDKTTAKTSYELLESSESDGDSRRERKRGSKKKKRKRERSGERGDDTADYRARKSGVPAWAGPDAKPAKDYYFDTHGDRDNLAFGCLYRMDIPRYKSVNSEKDFGVGFRRFYQRKESTLDTDDDIDSLDSKFKSDGRYWSPRYSALERHKSYKRYRILASKKFDDTLEDDFIPLTEDVASHESTDGSSSLRPAVEESWEDEVLGRTREFNKMTREYPHDERIWLEFAEFQDEVSSRQPQKGARLQTLEKKISILEKACELNPDNEDLLLALLKAYQRRDSSDVLIGRWEKILIQHSSSFKLWREFLLVLKGEFSRFKVTEARKFYAHAIQAIFSACSKQFRQVKQISGLPDSATIQLELGLVDIFLSLCRFEWQAGYQELATALLQAEIEFSLFSPSLYLTEQSKQRLFEHFWNGGGARVGEEGALGWSTWLEKEEEERQRAIKEEFARDDEKGGWTGWSEPMFKNVKTNKVAEDVHDTFPEEFKEEVEVETEDLKQEDDTEALLKILGIDVDAEPNGEVKDTSTWVRWSQEESSRDHDQWMPIHSKSAGTSQIDGETDNEDDEHLSSIILYEDISEYMFSLTSEAARLSLVSEFIDFFGGKISRGLCSNSSCWMEKILSLETFPDGISQNLTSVYNALVKLEASSNDYCNMKSLLGDDNNISQRTSMMTFLRNAILLFLNAFPRNHFLEEAALIAEELSVTKMGSSSHSITPCRVLAKSLLKNDRQDVLFCGVYAQREAAFGNIDHARRVFDMALSSVEVLPANLKSNAPLLYLWYAEMELSSGMVEHSESSSRAIHILSCLGSGESYSPFKSHPSNLQLLRSRQGFKERIKTVRLAWITGSIDDHSIAVICSASLFEELTTGWAAAVEVLDQSFAMVLPERRSNSNQLESLYNFYLRMLWRHQKQLTLRKIWDAIIQGLQIYPYNPDLFTNLVKVGHSYTTPNKLRLFFHDISHKKPSVILWLFALAFEMGKGNDSHRIHALFERSLADGKLRSSVVLWRCYVAYEIDIARKPSSARRVFFRAIHACPWSKKLWLDGFLKLHSVLTPKELSDLQEVMRDKELNLRTDIYEILLQDEIPL